MEELTCPNCHEKFKADLDKKYFDCPHCHFEFAERDVTKKGASVPAEKHSSLLEKIKNTRKSELPTVRP